MDNIFTDIILYTSGLSFSFELTWLNLISFYVSRSSLPKNLPLIDHCKCTKRIYLGVSFCSVINMPHIAFYA